MVADVSLPDCLTQEALLHYELAGEVLATGLQLLSGQVASQLYIRRQDDCSFTASPGPRDSLEDKLLRILALLLVKKGLLEVSGQ